MYPIYNEAKQTETLEFRAEKGLLQGQAKRWVRSSPKEPPAPLKCSGKAFLKARCGQGSHSILPGCDQIVHSSLVS